MQKRTKWIVGFLGVTGAALVMEVVGAVDGNDELPPWTDLIVQYVPGEVFALVFGGLVAWLTIHFKDRYAEKKRLGGWGTDLDKPTDKDR